MKKHKLRNDIANITIPLKLLSRFNESSRTTTSKMYSY